LTREMEKEVKQLSQVCELWENGVIVESVDGAILSWNKGARDLYGYSAAEVIGKKHSFLVPGDVNDDFLSILKRINQGAPVARYDTIHLRKDYSRMTVSLTISPVKAETGNIIAFAIFIHNTADQAQEKELFTALTQSSPIGIFIVNDGKFLYVNRPFERIVGYGINELINTETLQYIHPDDRELVTTHARAALKNGLCQPFEYRVITKTGQTKWVLETIISIHYQGRRAVLGNFMDITEMKRLAEETKLTNERLTALVKNLEQQHRQNAILTEMRDMLQACSKMDEIAPIIMGFMKKLFPSSQGALFLLSNSRTDLESVVTWGDFPAAAVNNIFPPDACWGLRRGRAHVVEDVSIGPNCPHLVHTVPAPYVCLPLMAKGDILGLLHLKNIRPGINSDIADLGQMAVTLSEYLSLSIANVKLSETLSRQSIQDQQSGLYNRRFMEESLHREIMRAARKKTSIGIIMGDIDHFKKFNDDYGHAAGDKIITHVGKIINDRFRGSDVACRYGGEEFLIILPETSLEDTFKRAEALREEIKKMEAVFPGQVAGTITMSLGVAAYPEKGLRMEDVLRVADTALYKAKQEGRDRVISG
jgi:diguanylate cyclase (GGDEF)-like protein/PAS domain S-box-containing protein